MSGIGTFRRQMTKKAGRSLLTVCRLLLIAVLALSLIPIGAAAGGYHADNAAGNTLSVFPAAGSGETEMSNNFGAIDMFYSQGHIMNNRGTISSSAGTVNVNEGTIFELQAGTVGTNFGVIEAIRNTGMLTVNDNDGVVKSNSNTIQRNYGTITANYGAVTMYDGEIEENGKSGTVCFSGPASRGTIRKNAGTVSTDSTTGQIRIISNTGTITIHDGTVIVEDNAGTITLMDQANLICYRNSGTITKSEDAETYVADCTDNFGEVTFAQNSTGSYSVTHDYQKIVFSGDDGKASVLECEAEYQGISYTGSGVMLVISLPADYICTNDRAMRDEADPSVWYLVTYLENDQTEYRVLCEKTIPHAHRFTFSADGNVIRAFCTGAGECADGYQTTPLILTLTADEGVYDGGPHAACTDDEAVRFAEITGATVGSIVYARDGETPGVLAPVDAGDYTASVTVTYDTDRTVTAEKKFTIAAAGPEPGNDFDPQLRAVSGRPDVYQITIDDSIYVLLTGYQNGRMLFCEPVHLAESGAAGSGTYELTVTQSGADCVKLLFMDEYWRPLGTRVL